MSECCVLLYALLGFNVISLNLQSLIYYSKTFFLPPRILCGCWSEKNKILGKIFIINFSRGYQRNCWESLVKSKHVNSTLRRYCYVVLGEWSDYCYG